MEPQYMNENRYSYFVGFRRSPITDEFLEKTPETDFELQVQALYMEGHKHLQKEEFQSALGAFSELMSLILHTADPRMPVDPNKMPMIVYPMHLDLIDTLAVKAAEILQKSPVPIYNFPSSLMSKEPILPGPVVEELQPAFEHDLQITSYHKVVSERLEAAMSAILEDEFELAMEYYTVTLKENETDKILSASLLHDMAILAEKADQQDKAKKYAQMSVNYFEDARQFEAQVQALDTLTGILRRAGNEELAAEQAKKALDIRKRYNFNPVVRVSRFVRTEPTVSNITRDTYPVTNLAVAFNSTVGETSESEVYAPTLMAMKYVESKDIQKCMNVQGTVTTSKIQLDANAAANIKDFLKTIEITHDLGIVTDFWKTRTKMVAYLPHMYFFVIPMSIGDCLAGMGNLAQALEQYLRILPYPYINKDYEIVKLWTRLAQVYLDIGDKAYRSAKDDVNAFGPARTAYECIVLGNRTLNPNSPLYKDAKFASIKTRVMKFLAAPDPVDFNDNPAITCIVLGALNKLHQIQAGLNFFGLPPNCPPPFSFEYMQNTARYFAQQASQIEQRYIQYMNQAENEEFRRDQLDQQVEVAKQSVKLEIRAADEAQAGIDVAEASVNYAEVQFQNAETSYQEFKIVRWALLILATAEACVSASEDSDRAKNISSLVSGRTTISHNLEENRLQRARDSAKSYKQVAEEQAIQAITRKLIAEQRVAIAQLQQKYAEENRDFLDMREFNAHLWGELALQVKRLKQRYLDMATEIAMMMERAYNAETERNLHVISSDYSITTANNLMGADKLLSDIDYFTYDYVTSVKTKKIPIKQVISLDDSYVMSFHQLKTTGRCFFQTELADFDRQHPGMYLCKLRNVEIIFVGLTNASSIVGSLRNIGISRFRRENGTILTRLYPSDVMVLSQYDFHQDALAFRFNPNELRLFENNGIDTFWQLDLPLHSNTFDYSDIIDVQFVLYYDGYFSPSLEQTITCLLPKNDTASKVFSLRMSFFDELYYLKHKGEAVIDFNDAMFPRNQNNLKRNYVTLKAAGKPSTVANLKLHLTSTNNGKEILLTTDAQGEVNELTNGQPLNALKNESMLDTWTLQVFANENPSLVDKDGVLNLTGLDDILFFFEYSFDYR